MGHVTILVAGLEHVFFFHSVGNFIIPTDEIIFFRGVGIPPTSLTLIGDVKHSLNGRIIRRFHGKMSGGPTMTSPYDRIRE